MSQAGPRVPAEPLRREHQGIPGEEGVWVFVLGDMVIFAVFFTGYLFYRAREPALFNRSQQQLDLSLGAANTLLLLTSSWLVVMAVEAIRSAHPARARGLLLSALACGGGFVGLKGAEYAGKFAHGISVITNNFFMYYFMFTGIHLLHVLIGLGALSVLWRRAKTASAADAPLFESVATFWHMVDLLWIMLFALLYLVK